MNIAKMMKQAQQMQGKMQAMQKELGDRLVEGQAGGGKVTATTTATGDIKSLRIDPAVVDPADLEMLEDLIVTAIRNAQEQGRQVSAAEMQKIAGGLGLPPGFGF